MSETCKHPDTWFSRTVCPEPCGYMHTYCTECSEPLDPCANRATPIPGVTEGQAGSGSVRVAGTCPACHKDSLMVMSGGHITCSRLECPSPCAVDDYLHGPQPAAPADDGFGEEYWRGFGAGQCEERERLEPSEDDRAALTDLVRNGLLGDDGIGVQYQRTDDGLPRDLARWIIDAGWRKPGVDDTAEVLAGLREEMQALADNPSWSWPGAMRRSIALVEAAQARLADRGRGGGCDG